MNLSSLTRRELIYPQIPGSDAPTVLRAFADRVADEIDGADADDLYRKLLEREQLGSTGIGSGVAIPHCKMEGLERPVLAVGICPRTIDFGAVDDEGVRLFFLVVSPQSSPAVHLQVLAAISKWVKHDRHVEKILRQPDRDAIFDLLDDDHAP